MATSKRRPPASRQSARLRADYSVLVDLLATTRRESGMTQRDVAEKLSTTQSWYAKCESGERRMDMLEVFTVLDALGADLDTFIRRLRRALKKAHL